MAPHPLSSQLPQLQRKRYRHNSIVMNKMDEFLEHIDPALAPSSRLIVRRCLWSLRRGLSGKPPTTENLLLWLRHRLATDRVSAATLSLERVYANSFFKWCIERGYLEKNPLTAIPTVPIKLVNKPLITEQQFESLVNKGWKFWPYLCTLAWYTGARSVDLVNLTWENASIADCVIRFIPRKTERSGRMVEIPMSKPVLDAVMARILDQDNDKSTPYVCPEAKQLHDRANGSFQAQFKRLCLIAELPGNITFHCFRHTRATRMLSGPDAVTPLVAADVLGLSSMNTLRRYSKASDTDKLKAVNL